MPSDYDPQIFRKVAADLAHGEEGHVESTDVRKTVDAPVGMWTDVRAGQRTAEGTVTRPEWPGIPFDADDPTKVVVWHLKRNIFNCNRRGIRPEQVVFEEGTGAPFCPTCLKHKKKLAKQSMIRGERKKKRLMDRLRIQQAFKGKITDKTKKDDDAQA